MKENLLLKEKVFDIREVIVEFAEWIDVELFGVSSVSSYRNKLLINHNLMFRKECIVSELRDIIGIAKNGIRQIQ